MEKFKAKIVYFGKQSDDVRGNVDLHYNAKDPFCANCERNDTDKLDNGEEHQLIDDEIYQLVNDEEEIVDKTEDEKIHEY